MTFTYKLFGIDSQMVDSQKYPTTYWAPWSSCDRDRPYVYAKRTAS